MTDYGPSTNEHDCTHCYHAENSTFTSYPPQYPEICCHCGDRRVTRPAEPPPPPGHGKYYPRQALFTYPYNTTTGSTRNCACRPENGGSGICGCVLGGPTITY